MWKARAYVCNRLNTMSSDDLVTWESKAFIDRDIGLDCPECDVPINVFPGTQYEIARVWKWPIRYEWSIRKLHIFRLHKAMFHTSADK